MAIVRSTAGWRASWKRASSGLPRSAASTYWVRSLVPMLKKSTSLASSRAMIAADGTSIMTPVIIRSGQAAPELFPNSAGIYIRLKAA